MPESDKEEKPEAPQEEEPQLPRENEEKPEQPQEEASDEFEEAEAQQDFNSRLYRFFSKDTPEDESKKEEDK